MKNQLKLVRSGQPASAGLGVSAVEFIRRREDHRSTIRILVISLCALLLLTACRARPAGLSHPTGVDVAADGSLYIMDHADLWHSRVVHVAADGKTLQDFKPSKTNPELVYSGWDMAIGPNGDIYYCNLVSNDERTLHDGVMAFSPDGAFLSEIGAADYAPNSSETAAVPYNLEVDSQGRIYVTDFNYNRLRVYNAQGKLLSEFTAENTPGFHYAGIGDVAVDDSHRLLYLTDFYEGRLDQYRMETRPDGAITLSLQFSTGEYGREPGQFSFPQNLALDEKAGTVYVGDMGNRRIQAFDPQGNFIAQFAPPVDEWQVLGLAVGPSGDGSSSVQVLYAADALNAVVWAFGLDGQFLRKIEVH